MGTPRDDRQRDLFKPGLVAIIDLEHSRVLLAERIDWGFLQRRFGAVHRPGAGQPPLPTRLMAGLAILKHMHSLSDEALCARWLENPVFPVLLRRAQLPACAPRDRSSLTRWRQRMGEQRLAALLQESLSLAHRSGAIESKDLERGWRLRPPSSQRRWHTRPTPGSCTGRGSSWWRWRSGPRVALRQSYARVAKRAAILVGRYRHAHQFNRARRQLRFLRARLGG